MKNIRVVLVEDHVIVREGLRLLIQRQPNMEVVGEAGDGATALELIVQLNPHITVLDISMPVMNGIDLLAKLRSLEHPTKVLILTANEDHGYMRRILKLGVDGYLLKRSAGDELIGAIQAIMDGERYLDRATAVSLIEDIRVLPQLSEQRSSDALSPREQEVLRLVALGFTNKEIAAQLDVSSKTVDTYKMRSMKKLALVGRSDIVRFAVQNGWLAR